jgi:hypothetical protein
MRRADVYLKLELDVEEDDTPEKVAAEICRIIRKVYGVRTAEVSAIVEKE